MGKTEFNLVVVGDNARFYDFIQALQLMDEGVFLAMEQAKYPIATNQDFFRSYCQIYKAKYGTEFTAILDSANSQDSAPQA